MEEISRGAESVVFRGEGRVVKIRVSKKYRLQEIDEKLNKSRTKMEKGILKRIEHLGIAPKILPPNNSTIELVESIGESLSYTIEMEYVGGRTLTEIWHSASPSADMEETVRRASTVISRLHSMGVIHGDLTLNNIILQGDASWPKGNGQIILLDFGLSKISSKAEDRAVDLYLFEKAVKSLTGCEYKTAIEQGYLSLSQDALMSTLARLEEVRRRGRRRELEAVG